MTIADKFFLGGPLNVRGFDTRGLGPSSGNNALGGEMYWATGNTLLDEVNIVLRLERNVSHIIQRSWKGFYYTL